MCVFMYTVYRQRRCNRVHISHATLMTSTRPLLSLSQGMERSVQPLPRPTSADF